LFLLTKGSHAREYKLLIENIVHVSCL
jgi:hypothetical protein